MEDMSCAYGGGECVCGGWGMGGVSVYVHSTSVVLVN